MRHRHPGGHGPQPWLDRGEELRRRHHHHHRDHRGGRLLEHGDLRLLLLALIAEQPRHGYEMMRALEERTGGQYSPSPGVIYPTLAWLEDMGYAQVESENGARKSYRITPEGEAFLAANRATVDALNGRLGAANDSRPADFPAAVVRAMENLRLALRLRKDRAIDQPAAETIATALDSAAQAIERS